MSTFLEAFPKLFNDELQKAKDHATTIVNSLEYMSRNNQDSSQETDKDPNYILTSNLSKDDLEKEYKKFKTQYNMVSRMYYYSNNSSILLFEAEFHL